MSVNYVNPITGELTNLAGGTLYADAPIGSVLAYAGSNPPSGWLLCQGQAISRTDYADLFSVIGTTFGSGNGTSTFNIPDMREVVPVGAGYSSRDGIATHDIYTLGQFKDDQLQDHRHTSTPYVMVANGTYSSVYSHDTPEDKGGAVTVGRHGTTTHGKQLGVNYIIRAKQTPVPTDFMDAVDDTLNEFSKRITLQPLNNSTINFDKSRIIGDLVAVCASIAVPSGNHLVKENALVNVPNYGTASIGYILPCLYRNMSSGAEEPGSAIIQTDGNLYSYYTKTEYNEIRINATYSSKI